MNPRLLELYNQELHHVRESAAEFAKEYPKIASRLTLSGMDCADPYVERLLEGFAYLTARVQLKLDAEYPTFTHNLLEIAYPHYLAPTPSMTVVQLQTDPDEGSLASGFPLPRDTVLRAALGRETQTCCEYRTAHPGDVVAAAGQRRRILRQPRRRARAPGRQRAKSQGGLALDLAHRRRTAIQQPRAGKPAAVPQWRR
ncbi:type VI protein secretion system component VasA [Pseudomonas synxantha]|nr:type VI protein secretion system component VasA [Pseudomonas synxantha]